MRAPINATKHYVQQSLSSITSGAVATSSVVVAVEQSTANAVNEVRSGSLVKAIMLEYWLKAGEATNLGSFVFAFYKKPAGAGAMTFAQAVALGTFTGKNQVFFTSQGLINNESSTAIPVIRQFIKIPKGKQRMALGEELIVVVAAVTSDLDFCGFTTYKEYF